MQTSPNLLSSKTGKALASLIPPALACLAPGPAMAQAVISSTGVRLLPTAPASVMQGAVQSNTQATAFQEKQGLTLTDALPVDVSAPGTYSAAVSLTPGSIAAGSKVDSFMFYTDPINNTGEKFAGSLTLDSNILGLIVLTKSLNQTDALLGAAGTTYPATDPNRGLEIFGTGDDSLTLSSDRRTVTFDFHTTGSVDEVRVVTSAAPVPEASTMVSLGLLLALSAGGLVVAAKRRKATA